MTTQLDANYSGWLIGGRRCGMCQNWQPATNTCSVVAGTVEPYAVCDLWERVTPADAMQNAATVASLNAAKI